ncbi:MAG: tetratricopeptide repeat protein [Candidatus Komeilibacteria bacterium]
MKNIKNIIILVIVLLVVIIGVYIYQITRNPYPELTDEVVQMIGGQDMANELIEKYIVSKQDLQNAISIYRDGGMKEEDKPDITLFVDYARNAKYIRKYEESVEVLKSIFDYYEKSDIALINLAHVYEDMGEYQKAIDTYLEFYDMFGVQIQQFHLDIMYDYMALGDKANVIKYYEEFRNEGYDSEEIRQYVTTP